MIYFDNAATSWPKPDAVRYALNDYFGNAGGNPGRSGHRMSIAAARIVEETREAVAQLFHANDPSRIIFTHNGTNALNIAIYGLSLGAGDHIITTCVEHNSVMRPLRHLESLGVECSTIASTRDGVLDLDHASRLFRSSTKLIVTTHASNVTGTIMPIPDLSTLARKHGVPYLVDSCQTAGSVPIDLNKLDVDMFAFTGHKGLMGPTGTGGLYIRDGLSLAPLIRGGTGSASAMEVQPEFLPDAQESGTPNVAGLAGLHAGVRFLSGLGLEQVAQHERALVSRFIDRAATIPGVSLYGTKDVAQRCGIVSFNVDGATPSEVCLMLDESFSIMARPGLHCAPATHRGMGTFPMGTSRFSFGWFNTADEIDASISAVREIAAWAANKVAPGA